MAAANPDLESGLQSTRLVPGPPAFHSVDGFVVVPVRMGQRHLRPHRNCEFKHRHGTTSVGSIEQESDSYLSGADNFVFHGGSGLLLGPCA